MLISREHRERRAGQVGGSLGTCGGKASLRMMFEPRLNAKEHTVQGPVGEPCGHRGSTAHVGEPFGPRGSTVHAGEPCGPRGSTAHA